MATKKRYGFVIDISRCIDCRACLVACSVENNVGMQYTRIWVKDTGLVLVDQEACIGCGYCVEACPYDARYLDRARGVVDKCTGCIQRVLVGQQPACVTTCVGKARLFGDLNDPNSEVSVALKNAKAVQRLDYEKNGVDTDQARL